MARGVNGISPVVARLPPADHLLDLGAGGREPDAERGEDLYRRLGVVAQQAEQDVLRADVVVVEQQGLFFGVDHDAAGGVGEPLEQLDHLGCGGVRKPLERYVPGLTSTNRVRNA